MANKELTVRISMRNDAAANWQSVNPVLLKGEMGIESDTSKFKFGDGTTAWNDLPYGSSDEYLLPTATSSVLGGVKIGDNVTVDAGKISITKANVEGALGYSPATKDTATQSANGLMSSADKTKLDGIAEGANKYQLPTATTSVLGGVKSQAAGNDKVVVASDGTMSVSKVTNAVNAEKATTAAGADKLNTAHNISLSGDATGSTSFDGSADKTISVTLANSGVTVGTYPKVTVDAKGRVTKGEALTAADIPNLTLARITDAGTAASKDVGTASGQVPVLDSNGKLNTSVLPALAISDTHVVANQAAMLALNAQVGDIAVRTDESKSYILQKDGAATLANWVELATPADKVQSVNGKTGAVTLTTSDVEEGTRQYYTEARATANFNTNIAKTASTALSDSDTICRTTDTYILNCGNA